MGLTRLEIGSSSGTGKLRVTGGIEGAMRESIQRAFAYIQGHKVEMGIAQAIDTLDFHVEAIDLLNNHVSCDAGIGLVVAIYSLIKKHPVLPGLLILGVSADIVERVDPIFYGDPLTAAVKARGTS